MIPGPDFKSLATGIIEFPLVTAVVLILFGARLERLSLFGRQIRGVTGWLASAAIARSFIAGIVGFFEVIGRPEEQRAVTVRIFDWITVGDFQSGVDFLIDPLSIVMVLVVSGVGTLIHVYSVGYMKDDPRFPRYFAYLNLFAASMLLLVLADNLLLFYVGWEAVGLCSYLLIGFWFQRDTAANAAKKAFVVNRIGDFAFLIGIFVLSAEIGSLTMGQINAQAGAMTAGLATVVSLLLFAGATGKSAQIPLYVWLPDAMEGPTPVSALIHAATMVTAGVYMVARLAPVFEASGGAALMVVAWIGALTALFAAIMATAEYDIKRVLAYSTISQLGYMFLAAGVGAYSIAIFHLVTHAFFKALMFLGAGAVMHALQGETDMRNMGGLRKLMPITGLTFMAGWLAISGIIPFSGFFSKDAILAAAWAEGEYVLWAAGVGTALITAFYMSRLYFRVFEGRESVPEGVHVHDAPPIMAAALVPLGALAVAGGVVNLPGILTLEHFLEGTLGEIEVAGGATAFVLGGIALLFAFAGIKAAQSLYLTRTGATRRRRLESRYGWLVTAARHKFWVDEAYGAAIVRPAKAMSTNLTYVFDTRFIDGAVNGLGRLTARVAEASRRVQTGYVRNYAAMFLFGAVILFSIVVLRVATG